MSETYATETSWFPPMWLTLVVGLLLAFLLHLRSTVPVRFYADKIADVLVNITFVLLPPYILSWIVARPRTRPARHAWTFFIAMLSFAAFMYAMH
jgi:hypothetical protein